MDEALKLEEVKLLCSECGSKLNYETEKLTGDVVVFLPCEHCLDKLETINPTEPGYYWYSDSIQQDKILVKVNINKCGTWDVEFFNSEPYAQTYMRLSDEQFCALFPTFWGPLEP